MIRIEDLWKTYREHVVLKGVSLEIREGETLVILGRSGSGKSVLLRQIIGIEKPDSGKIYIDDVELTSLKEEALYQKIHMMGMLFQSGALLDSLTVGENVAFYLKEHNHLSDQEMKEQVALALQMVGLEGIEEKMPSDLSGGMKKRAALARLIAYSPKILLYDEPTTGLDPITAMQINDLILKTQKELHATSIVVTHDLCSAFHIADRIALNHEGQILYITPKDEFPNIEDPRVQTFLQNAIPESYLKHAR
ncbi:MAG: putative ribonucleotide transport ATP-binding protein mkl [Chlamydiae bacterium]|nr:putative ribonucleotide transport ATP-binding protein mkl [Chlamydiota bacterium]